MKEDIKILEDYILHFEKIGGEEIIKSDEIIKTIEYKEIKAIGNLLQENKCSKEAINTLTNKLEKVVDDNNELRKYYASRKEVEDLKETIACLHESSKEMFIPISVIQNTLKEINKKEKEELKGLKGQDRYFVKQMYQYMRKPLQEILEKGNK